MKYLSENSESAENQRGGKKAQFKLNYNKLVIEIRKSKFAHFFITCQI